MSWRINLWLLAGFLTLAVGMGYAQSPNVSAIGGFESDLPAYWTKGNQPSGTTLTWVADQTSLMGHSLKIEKTATGDSASWISTNMCDIWSPKNDAGRDIQVGIIYKTSGVNTLPANDDARWWVSYNFYDSAGTFIGNSVLPLNQTIATSAGWLTSLSVTGANILPRASYKTIVKFVAGKNATGTVWATAFTFNDITVGGNGWGGQDWNTQVGVPTGWFYWLPPIGGNDGVLSNGFENTKVTTEAAHTGTHSLKFDLPFNRAPHDGFVATRWAALSSYDPSIKPGDMIRASVWIKASHLVPDSAAKYPNEWAVGFTTGFFSGTSNNQGYNPVGSQVDHQFAFPADTMFGWTKYWLDVAVPNSVDAKAFELRLHVYNRFTGTIYFDDLNVEKIEAPTVAAVGGFEGDLPAYWTKGNQPSGSVLTWATDQSNTMGHSLKIEKTATGDSASWISTNMCDIWSPKNDAGRDIQVGVIYKTSGVNTSPANDDAKWWVSYNFYDSAGTFIGETKLALNQTTASSAGWLTDMSASGSTILPRASYKTIVKFVAGKNATGIVWADAFTFNDITVGGSGWGGQDWNTEVGVPTGWFYWLPPIGGNDGVLANGFENTTVTTEAAHSGTHSLKFDLPFDRAPHDGFVSTRWSLLNNVNITGTTAKSPRDISNLGDVHPGDWLRLSVWIKASNLVPDSAAKYPNEWAVGFTPGFFSGVDNNQGYNPVGGQTDYQFAFPAVTSFGWTKYSLDIQVPNDVNAKAIELRLHVYNRFTGTIYFDDLGVEKLDAPTVATVGGFEGDLPAYWTKGNQPNGSTLTWATDQSRTMGHSLKIEKTATGDSASWISTNMCDIWSPKNDAGRDIQVGVIYRTSNVNTSPANDDAKWWVSYSFYDSADTFIGETKIALNQTTATSAGWLTDLSPSGSTILPRASYRTIVKFVAGKNATGTVWADAFTFNDITVGGSGWGGQDWNTEVGVPTGWYYWLPPIGGNDGVLANGFENTTVTTEAAHTGTHSLKFDLPFDRAPHDGFVATRWSSLASDVKPGTVLRLTVWIKATNLVPDSAAKYPNEWAVGFTPGFFAGIDNNQGYNPVGGQVDYQFAFPALSSFDWTPYTLDVIVPNDITAKALEVRLHVYNRFTGTIYFDDLTVEAIGTATGVVDGKNGAPRTWELANNYPNPFNPTTVIPFSVPQTGSVSLKIYNVVGQEVRTLVDGVTSAGTHQTMWDGRNNAGQLVQSGVYFVRMQSGQTALVRKMLLVK